MIRKQQLVKAAVLFACGLLAMNTFAAVNDSAIKVKWGYIGNIGPSNWSKLDPAFALCSTGKTQSPINIKTKKAKNASNDLKIKYNRAPIDIIDDGTTELLLGIQQTIINDGHTIQLNFPRNNTNEEITLQGKAYQLVQFHFHSPSETQLNGQSYPLEIHFVHQGENGSAVVIGVLVQSGASNPTLQNIIDHLPKQVGKEEFVPGHMIDPASLLPEKIAYYSFMGSLTTPPCTEGLEWIVMSDFITATPAQLLELRKAIGEPNARDVQSLNKRRINFSSARV